MKVTMYNVGFGESILLSEEDRQKKECLLVDFGSDTPACCCIPSITKDRVSLQEMADHIVEDTQEKTVSVLLSHFHRDHLEGFLSTDLTEHIRLGDTYIPDITLLSFVNGKLSFLQVQLLQELFEAVLLYKTRLKRFTLHDLLVKLMRENTTLYFLSRGNTFHVGHKCYHVLWPDFSRMSVNPKLANHLTKLLTALSPTAEEDEAAPLARLDEYIEELVGVYRALAAGYRDTQGRLARLEELQEQVIVFYSNLLEQGNEEIITALKNSLQAMKEQGNRISIVFYDTPVQGKADLLMTGDIPVSDLKKIPFNKLTFKAIKAPHHGTTTHFWTGFPKCEKILISNGKPSAQHKRWHKIAYEYAAYYHSNRGCQVFCTNPRCEMFDLLPKGARLCAPCCKTIEISQNIQL